MLKYLMGIDIGTSSCKVALFDERGTVVGTASEEYPVYYPQSGYVEQNPEEWWEAVCKATKKCIEKSRIKAKQIVGIGVDGQSWSAIPIDECGNVLMNTPIWSDTRSAEICKQMNDKLGERTIFDLAGNTLQAPYTTGKILWYKENFPEMYQNIFKILQSNSFIVYRLTNKISQDKSQGYGLHCFDMREGEWDKGMCEDLGIPLKILPEIYECSEVVGFVTDKAAEQTGLCVGTPVVAGGLDAACGALGVGVLAEGDTQEQGGQAGGMSICCETYQSDPSLILGYHVVPGKWLLQGGTTGGGGVMRWIERELGEAERLKGATTQENSFDLLTAQAEQVPAGSEGVVFLPYMSGERSPIWDPNAKGVFYGLDFSKTKGHLIRSAMEGVAYSLRHNLEVAQDAGSKVKVLRAMGGAANSYLWTQIKTDITGKEVVVPASDTATTLGAAILAGVGVGLYKDFEEAISMTTAIKRSHVPDAQTKEIYDKGYEKYLKLYQNLKEMMKEE